MHILWEYNLKSNLSIGTQSIKNTCLVVLPRETDTKEIMIYIICLESRGYIFL